MYLTALLPPAILAEEIDEIRKEISVKYHVMAALKPPVHITLYKPVKVDTNMDSLLIKLLNPLQFSHAPFTMDLKNYDSFNNKTLFIHCTENAALNHLHKGISGIFNRNKIDPAQQKGNTRFHPHITVAYRDVEPTTFTALWDEFKSRKLKRSFLADHFTLLKHSGKRWEILQEFPLKKPEELSLFTF